MPLPVISQAKLKLLLALDSTKGREREGALLVEGVRLIDAAIEAGLELVTLAADERGARVASSLIERAGDRAFSVSPEDIERVSETVNAQGVVAAFRIPATGVDVTRVARPLVLDNLRDPGNVGLLLRHAAAFGCDAVILTKGCVDPWNPKVVRASMGGAFTVKLDSGREPAEVATLLTESGCPVYALDPSSSAPSLFETAFPARSGIVVGGETEGLHLGWYGKVEHVRIPQTPGVESCNAAVAASIALAWRYSQSLKTP